jgi:iron complex outermembrane recepter protein
MSRAHSRTGVRRLIRGASHLGFLAVAGAASAQAQLASTPTSNETPGPQVGELTEVVVTAQRRTETLESVPISIQAISSGQLESKGVADTRDLATISPMINFSTGNSANATAFSLRGVSSLAVQNGIQPSTAMVVDGVALARQSEFIANLADIDHIEVLNGPQGTLFGKNSTAGVINIVTNPPAGKYEALIEGLATTDSEFGVRAMANMPITDAIRIRLNGFYRDQEPLIKNIGPAPDVLGAVSYGGNFKIAADLASNVDVLLSASYSHINSSAGQFFPEAPSIFGALQQDLIAPATICRCKPTINTDEPAIDTLETSSVSATFNWRIAENLTLISITDYSQFSEDSSVDEDLTPVGIIVGKGESTPGTGYPFEGIYVGLKPRFPDRFHYISEEIRLNYVAGPLNTVLGGYLQDYHDKYSLDNPTMLDGSLLGLTPGTSFFNSQYPHAKILDTTASAFGDATYSIAKLFKVFGGVRITHERVGVDYHRDDYLGPASLFDATTGVFGAPPIDTVNTRSAHNITNVSGRAGVQFEPTRDYNFYFSYARGYKAPAVDVSQTLAAGKDPIIQPEIADSLEIGSKLRLFENRLALNIALFDEKIHGIQLGIIQSAITFNPVLINAGTLRTRGVEADSRWAVTPKLEVTAALAYDDATYSGLNYVCNSTQLATTTCPNTPTRGFQNITGQQAIEAPKFKYSVGAHYADTFPDSNFRYYADVNWTWNSSIYYELGQDPLSREPGHGMLNASLGFRGPGDKWGVQIFGKNLTNEFFYADLNNVAIIGRPIGYLTRDFQRYGGVRLTFRY